MKTMYIYKGERYPDYTLSENHWGEGEACEINKDTLVLLNRAKAIDRANQALLAAIYRGDNEEYQKQLQQLRELLEPRQ
ncbi:MAG: hypothetical protein KKF08_18900 [Gammaproteobacteria bacterium]|nr:hypothetical protein [Gammaproteobacteria bacterium]